MTVFAVTIRTRGGTQSQTYVRSDSRQAAYTQTRQNYPQYAIEQIREYTPTRTQQPATDRSAVEGV